MTAIFHSAGTHLDYTPSADTLAGTLVVIGGTTGIVNTDIPANTLGAACIRGTILLAKASATVFADGAVVNYDQATGLATAAALAAGIISAGHAVGATGANGSTQVVVLLLQ